MRLAYIKTMPFFSMSVNCQWKHLRGDKIVKGEFGESQPELLPRFLFLLSCKTLKNSNWVFEKNKILFFCETQIWSATLCWNSYKCLRLWNESLRKFLQKNLESVSFINQHSICVWGICLFKFEILWPVHSSPLNQLLIQLVNPHTKFIGQPASLS